MLDLHSKRGTVDLAALAALAEAAGGTKALCAKITASNTAAEAFAHAAAEGVALGDAVAAAARETALGAVADGGIAVDIAVFDRDGMLLGHAPEAVDHEAPPLRNLRR
jgi:cobalt-precorrin-5B (C1)-methyltransferase